MLQPWGHNKHNGYHDDGEHNLHGVLQDAIIITDLHIIGGDAQASEPDNRMLVKFISIIIPAASWP
jgi:hypothetical protein